MSLLVLLVLLLVNPIHSINQHNTKIGNTKSRKLKNSAKLGVIEFHVKWVDAFIQRIRMSAFLEYFQFKVNYWKTFGEWIELLRSYWHFWVSELLRVHNRNCLSFLMGIWKHTPLGYTNSRFKYCCSLLTKKGESFGTFLRLVVFPTPEPTLHLELGSLVKCIMHSGSSPSGSTNSNGPDISSCGVWWSGTGTCSYTYNCYHGNL